MSEEEDDDDGHYDDFVEGARDDVDRAEEIGMDTSALPVREEMPEDDGEGEFARMLPEWNPRSRRYGIYAPKKGDLHGTAVVAVGPAGMGKTRSFQTLCAYAWPMVHRAVLVSSTNVRSMQFDELNLFQQDAIIEHPQVEMMDSWLKERNLEMRLWREDHDAGEEYEQRSFLYVFDDMGFASKILYRRTDGMLEAFSNRRHLALHIWMALQHMGQLNKQLRMQVGIYIFVREQLAGGLAAMWETCFKGSKLSPNMFRQMVDEVCIKGKRVLVFIPGEGRMFKWTLPTGIQRMPRPLGSSAWHELGRQYRVDRPLRGVDATEELRRAAAARARKHKEDAREAAAPPKARRKSKR